MYNYINIYIYMSRQMRTGPLWLAAVLRETGDSNFDDVGMTSINFDATLRGSECCYATMSCMCGQGLLQSFFLSSLEQNWTTISKVTIL